MYNSENSHAVNNGSTYVYASNYCSDYQSYTDSSYYPYTTGVQASYPNGCNWVDQGTTASSNYGAYDYSSNNSLQYARQFGSNDLQSNGYERQSNVGMSLLQKMGWSPGEGLGKFKDGNVEPLNVKRKYGKMGLMSYEEYRNDQNVLKSSGLTKRESDFPKLPLKDKHPVTALMEYSAQQHLSPPIFKTYLDMPPPVNQHSMSVVFEKKEYKPLGTFKTKKDAKKAAAVLCLTSLNVL